MLLRIIWRTLLSIFALLWRVTILVPVGGVFPGLLGGCTVTVLSHSQYKCKELIPIQLVGSGPMEVGHGVFNSFGLVHSCIKDFVSTDRGY